VEMLQKKAPPNTTNDVKLNSHLRPIELTINVRSSSDDVRINIDCPPWTKRRNTNMPPNTDMSSHQ